MKTISSAEFRKTYPRLAGEPFEVQANGHPIGVWYPASEPAVVDPSWPLVEVGGEAVEVRYMGDPKMDRLRASQTQAERDAILRRINRSG